MKSAVNLPILPENDNTILLINALHKVSSCNKKKNETFCTSCLVLRHAVRWLLKLFMQNISCLSCLCLYTANQINKKYYLQKKLMDVTASICKAL